MNFDAPSYLSQFARFRMTEGTPIEGTVILEFPTFEEVEAWYDRPAYQEAVQHRLRANKISNFHSPGCKVSFSLGLIGAPRVWRRTCNFGSSGNDGIGTAAISLGDES
jgi:hypothetical protein